MDFRLSDTENLIANTITSLVAESRQGSKDRSSQPGSALWPRLAELGLLGIELDEADGGSGADFGALAAMLEALGRGGGAGDFIPVVVLAMPLIARIGEDTQKAAVLPHIVAGRLKPVLAHYETDDYRSDPVAATAIAIEGGWKISGHKRRVFAGDGADLFVVSAMTQAGTTLFLVPANTEGLFVRTARLYDGSGAADIELAECVVPTTARLGPDGAAERMIAWSLDRAVAAHAVEAVGLMTELCDMTIDHLRTREQFGQIIGKFQVLQHRAVDMRIQLELARSMAMLASVAVNDSDDRRRSRDVSAAKAAIGRASRTICQSAIQLHGAIALTAEYPAGAFVKRLTLIERSFGDTAWHLRRFAERSSTGNS